MKKHYAIGQMSGTSLDGLDLCYVEFAEQSGQFSFKILAAETLSYSEAWNHLLEDAINLSAPDLLALNSDYGFYLGQQISAFISRNKIEELDVIACHGHTVHHQPHRKFTMQIGDGRAVKILNNYPVVYDFRSQDVLLGGNGAPLVPIGDEFLFPTFDACLNLGGFSNISLKAKGKRIAFDICPVNIVLNEYAQEFGKKFDEDGLLAKGGTVQTDLLAKLNAMDFYQSLEPKSLGLEWVKTEIFPLFTEEESQNILATFTEHAAQQIARIFNHYKLNNVLVTGGGAYNQYLIERIKAKSKAQVILPEPKIIDYKEALIFAFMGVLKLENRINVLSSATGSQHDHSTGILLK